jgi:hypothetical protein
MHAVYSASETSSIPTTAIVALVGTLIGATIGAATNYVVAVRKEKADAKEAARKQKIEVKRAARLLRLEIYQTRQTISAALALRKGPEESWVTLDAWKLYASVVAAEFPLDTWDAVVGAYWDMKLFDLFVKRTPNADLNVGQRDVELRNFMRRIEEGQNALAPWAKDT